MSSIGIIVSGSQGKMGREVVDFVRRTEGLELLGEWYRDHIVEVKGGPDREVAVVDFSVPEFLVPVLQKCQERGFPVVSGTTGLGDHQWTVMREAAQRIPLLWSPNMSLGMAFVRRVLETLAPLADRADFQIEEWHHRHKRDAPSGTALWLQEGLERSVGKKIPPPLSVRGGGVFGVHRVMALMEEEIISLEHTALNRRVFVRGALGVVPWLVSQKPGLYSLAEALFDPSSQDA